MTYENRKDDTYEMIEILENATVFYTDGTQEKYDAIHITDKWVFTGHVLNNEVFVEGGGIPKENVKHIEHNAKRKIRKKKSVQ